MQDGMAKVMLKGWQGIKAHSYRTRPKYGRRLEIFVKDDSDFVNMCDL